MAGQLVDARDLMGLHMRMPRTTESAMEEGGHLLGQVEKSCATNADNLMLLTGVPARRYCSQRVLRQYYYAEKGKKEDKSLANPKKSGSFALTFNGMGSFQSGQMGQTVNLLLLASVVRIHHYPQKRWCNTKNVLFHLFL
jgi:hypothetical protein